MRSASDEVEKDEDRDGVGDVIAFRVSRSRDNESSRWVDFGLFDVQVVSRQSLNTSE